MSETKHREAFEEFAEQAKKQLGDSPNSEKTTETQKVS